MYVFIYTYIHIYIYRCTYIYIYIRDNGLKLRFRSWMFWSALKRGRYVQTITVNPLIRISIWIVNHVIRSMLNVVFLMGRHYVIEEFIIQMMFLKYRIHTSNVGLKPTFEVFIRLKTRLKEVFFQKC